MKNIRLQPLKCKNLAYASCIFFSKTYIIGCTGTRAIILDKQFQLIQIIEGLFYVYSAEVSPDEKNLLLISTGNVFYVVNLESFEKSRVSLRAPYNGNIEGRG